MTTTPMPPNSPADPVAYLEAVGVRRKYIDRALAAGYTGGGWWEEDARKASGPYWKLGFRRGGRKVRVYTGKLGCDPRGSGKGA